MAAVQFSLAQTWTIFGNNSRRAKKNVTFFSRSSEFFPFSSRRFFNVFPFPLFSLIVYLSSILFFWCWSESTWREKTCQPIATKVLDRLLLIPFLALHSNTQTLNKHLKTSIQLHSLCLTWPRLLCCLVLTKKFTLQKSSIVSKQDPYVPNIKRFHGFSCSNLLRHLLQSPFASHLHCKIGRNHIQNPPSMLAVNEKWKSAPSWSFQ